MPDWTSDLTIRLAGLALTPEREAEIVEELSGHLDQRFDELAMRHPAAEARRRALAELDADHDLADRLSRLRQARAASHLPPPPGAVRRRLVGDVWMDLRYAVRLLWRQRGLTAAAISMLAIGIGANTAIFSMVDAMLLRPIGVASVDQIYYVGQGRPSGAYSYPAYLDVRDHAGILEDIAAVAPIAATLSTDANSELVNGSIVTGNFFSVLGVDAARGRLLTRDDDVTPMAHRVAVISHGLWQRRFGGAADIVGRELLLNGHRFAVVGITPAAFRGAQIGATTDVYVPMMMQSLMRPPRAGYSGEMDPDLLSRRDMSWLLAIGRLPHDVTPEAAEAGLSAFVTSRRLELNPSAEPRTIGMPLTPFALGSFDQRATMVSAARLLLLVVGAVLLIGCANVANLLLAKAASRQGEVALRLAVGASRGRLVRQLLTESMVLSVAGGAAGVIVAWVAIAAFQAAPPPAGALPVAVEFATDLRVLGFALGLSLVTGVIFGLAPALASARPDLLSALKTDAKAVAGEGRRGITLGKALIIAEVALSLTLLVTAGLFVRSLQATRAVDAGIDIERLVTAPLNVNLLRYTRDQGRRFYQRAIDAMESLPGVEAAAVARVPVLSGAARSLTLDVEGVDPATDADRGVLANVVSSRFFDVLGIDLLEGRRFTNRDDEGTPLAVIVNETLARRHLAGQAIGKRVRFTQGDAPWLEVIGVVADSKYRSVGEPTQPTIYLPITQNHETGVTLYVRSDGEAAGVVGPVRATLRSLEPNLPASSVEPAADALAGQLYAARMAATLLAALGAVALVLAAIGIYGVMAFSTARRTHEVGIRIALGADTRAVVGLMVRDGMQLVAIGLGLGLLSAAIAAHAVRGFLYGIAPLDDVTFVAGPVLLTVVAAAACLLPAWRATRVDPTTALRSS